MRMPSCCSFAFSCLVHCAILIKCNSLHNRRHGKRLAWDDYDYEAPLSSSLVCNQCAGVHHSFVGRTEQNYASFASCTKSTRLGLGVLM